MQHLKTTLCLCMVVMLFLLCACTPVATKEPGGTTTVTQPTASPDAEPTPLSDDAWLENLYADGYTTNTLIGMDEFGRVFDAAGPDNTKKQVGMFYWPWFRPNQENEIYDNSKILAMPNGLGILTDPALPDPEASPVGATHWWGEPLFGYYNSRDEWVIRRHLRMLELAGVDYIAFDSTNGIPFVSEARRVLDCIYELQQAGFDPPRLTFYTHSRSTETMRKLYNHVYKVQYRPSAWYTFDGKPLIIGYASVEDDIKEYQASFGNDSYNPEPFTQEMLDFFYFARPEWPSEYKTYSDSIAWVEWNYPAPIHAKFNCMTLSPAAHPGVPFSASLTGRHTNWGRGWNPDTKQNVTEDATQGTFYQRNWNIALAYKPDMVFLGGWNEWTMSKFLYEGEYALVDNVNLEYSRDLEPMKDGYNDAFYLQTIQNIRRYKKTELRTNATFANITPTNDFDWSTVQAVFRKTEAVNQARDAAGAAKSVYYTQDAARNNIQEIRVARDAKNLYFHIRCEQDITARQDDSSWMNLFLGTGDLAQKGWEGYEYVINRSSQGSIDKLNHDFSTEQCASAQVEVAGSSMTVTVPRSALGLSATDNNFYFKVADHITDADDIMDYYVSGCSVPMGRMSFRYVG